MIQFSLKTPRCIIHRAQTNIPIRKVVDTIIRSLGSILAGGKKKKDLAHAKNITQHGNHKERRRDTNWGQWTKVHCDFDKKE